MPPVSGLPGRTELTFSPVAVTHARSADQVEHQTMTVEITITAITPLRRPDRRCPNRAAAISPGHRIGDLGDQGGLDTVEHCGRHDKATAIPIPSWMPVRRR